MRTGNPWWNEGGISELNRHFVDYVNVGGYPEAARSETVRVLDQDSGQARSPASLSGGEQFIASLSLALGMVEMMARSGGRLESLFLDEGFGSLDRNNLDAAVSNRLGQLRRTWQVTASQNLVTDLGRDGDLPEETSKEIESLCRCEPDQRTRIGYDEPFRHASTASASSPTVSEVPLTTGIPSSDT